MKANLSCIQNEFLIFIEIIAARDLKSGRCRQTKRVNEEMTEVMVMACH